MAHVVGYHHGGEPVLLDELVGQLQYDLGVLRVEGRGVLVQQDQFRPGEDHHQQGQRLALAAGKEGEILLHPVFEPHLQLDQFGAEGVAHLLVQAPLQPLEPFFVSDHHVVFQAHVRGRAEKRILEDPADVLRPLVLRVTGNVRIVQADGAGCGGDAAGDQVEEGGFAGTVAADDGDEVPLADFQVDAGDRLVLVHRPLVEDHGNILELNHFSPLP